MAKQIEKRRRGRPAENQGVSREEILKIALRLFAKEGYGGLSFLSLAKEIGVRDSNLYHHFGNKEELWKSALRFRANEIQGKLEDLSRLIKDMDGLEQLKLLHKQLVYISAEYPEFQQIIVQEVFSKSARSEWLITELLTPIYSYLDELRKAEQAKGRIKKIPSANMTSFIIGSITTLFSRSYQMRAQYGVDSFDKEEVEQHADMINDLLFYGMIVKE